MSLGRVYMLVYEDGATVYTDGPFCPRGSTLDACFFEPLTSCTPADAGYRPDDPSTYQV
jgi:hypothetical protein